MSCCEEKPKMKVSHMVVDVEFLLLSFSDQESTGQGLECPAKTFWFQRIRTNIYSNCYFLWCCGDNSSASCCCGESIQNKQISF